MHTQNTCEYQSSIDRIRNQLNRALVGKEDVIEMVIACLLAKGHLLFDDLPGLGKTTLAKALAAAIGGQFSRVQCTPDLMPSDVTGFNVFNQQSREFEFRSGPVFCDILLADEVNRTTPRTQSALFEAMAERQVTVDNHCYELSDTFFVVATQNPLDSHGAFPLPEAQLDRFAMKLKIGLPGREAELRLLSMAIGEVSPSSERAEPAIDTKTLSELQKHVEQLQVAETVKKYLLDLVDILREHPSITGGISPRAVLTWLRVAQAIAHLRGRDFVIPDDIQDTAYPVLSVRLGSSVRNEQEVIEDMLSRVEVPIKQKA